MVDLTRTAFGTWSGGRYMHFGEKLDEERYLGLINRAYEKGTRTFMTADVYGQGAADEMLARGLASKPRDSYCLVGAVGHDFYTGQREGARGFPRFTDASLRTADDYADYLRMATEKELERCGAEHFDLLLLHNPDVTGYTSEAVWEGMAALKEAGLTKQLGLAPGPANGFTLDMLVCMEKFADTTDWAAVVMKPLGPWPGASVLEAAEGWRVGRVQRVSWPAPGGRRAWRCWSARVSAVRPTRQPGSGGSVGLAVMGQAWRAGSILSHGRSGRKPGRTGRPPARAGHGRSRRGPGRPQPWRWCPPG